MKGVIFLILFLGFWLLFREIRLLEHVSGLLLATRWDMDVAARQRNLEGRRKLLHLQQEHTMWTALEKILRYSGLKMRFQGLTAEIWIAGNLAAGAMLAALLSIFFDIRSAVIGVAVFIAAEFLFLQQLRNANLRAVNEHLMKLLDFLGNYSITAGDVTSVFHQVSRYMEEPIKSALDTCYYEAQTTGDMSLALLSMAEKIEHPKFKELARNMEISQRYCADFTALVSGSRRSMREYLRISQERKGMLREAFLNMLLLFGLSLVVLVVVGNLVQMSVVALILHTPPGRAGIVAAAAICLLFMGQVHRSHC